MIPLNAAFPLSALSSDIAWNDNSNYYLKSESLADSWLIGKPTYSTKTYAMTLVATLNDDYYSNTVDNSITWTISMTDPCLTATIVDNVTITDMHTTVKVGSYVTQSFVNYKDSFSSTYGT